jgi:hypothetical protein
LLELCDAVGKAGDLGGIGCASGLVEEHEMQPSTATESAVKKLVILLFINVL